MGEVDNLGEPLLMHLGVEDEFISKAAQAQSKAALAGKQTRRSTAIRGSVMPSPGIMEHTTMPRRQRSPTGGLANFCINNFGDFSRSSVAAGDKS